MAKVVNLNKFRKRRDKVDEAKRAAENRVKHGRTKAERQRDALQGRRLESRVDGAKLERDADEPREPGA